MYLSSINGCDSIIITDLTVGNTSISNNNVSICQGSYYSVGSSIYSQTEAIFRHFIKWYYAIVLLIQI